MRQHGYGPWRANFVLHQRRGSRNVRSRVRIAGGGLERSTRGVTASSARCSRCARIRAVLARRADARAIAACLEMQASHRRWTAACPPSGSGYAALVRCGGGRARDTPAPSSDAMAGVCGVPRAASDHRSLRGRQFASNPPSGSSLSAWNASSARHPGGAARGSALLDPAKPAQIRRESRSDGDRSPICPRPPCGVCYYPAPPVSETCLLRIRRRTRTSDDFCQ